MKNLSTLIIIVALLLVLFSSITCKGIAEAGTIEYHKAVIVWIDYQNDEFTVMDLTDGELWIYNEIEDWQVWDGCIIAFENSIPTDYIRYTGYYSPLEKGFIAAP